MTIKLPWGSGLGATIIVGNAPTVSAISPNSGTAAGGTAVTITGTNFIAGATVTIGGGSATSVVVVSGTSITCVTPVGSTGAAQDVIVTTSNGSGTGSGLYTFSFAVPDILNNASFEASDGNGTDTPAGVWDGWTDNTGNAKPKSLSGLVRATDQAYTGTYAIKATCNANVGEEACGEFIYHYGTRDEVYARFYFRLDNTIGSILKFFRFNDSAYSDQLGGFFLDGSYGLTWIFDPELKLTPTSNAALLVPWASLSLNAWHYAECRYKRNGDASGWPTVQIWINGTQLTTSELQYPGSTTTYWSNGWLYAGCRQTSAQLGYMHACGTHNASDANTTHIWLDRIAFSSAANGRIGD